MRTSRPSSRVITGQIEAFRADDGARAYGYAAPMIKQIFPNPDVFMDMVRQGYQPVYRPQSFSFGEAGFSASGRPIQRVTVVGPDGITYEAIYTMERQPDGSWQSTAAPSCGRRTSGREPASGIRNAGRRALIDGRPWPGRSTLLSRNSLLAVLAIIAVTARHAAG